MNCPANPGAWQLHGVFHKNVRKQRKAREDGGVGRQQVREVAEEAARYAAQSGDRYDELLAEGVRYASKQDWRKAARYLREAIALEPDEPSAYANLGAVLSNSGHNVKAAQRYLEAKECYRVGSELWARATADGFNVLREEVFNGLSQEECGEAAKPEWWNDEGLKALSARVVRAAPNEVRGHCMRAMVLSGQCDAWGVGPRSAAELKEAATHFDRAAALCDARAPAANVHYASLADACRSIVAGQ